MAHIFTPVNQNRLTNVAIVRLKKAGKRFEIACYKNKVLSWREKVEHDLDEVLQSHSVFLNVSKGVHAKKEDLMKAFGTDDKEKVCVMILEKGDLQVSEKERKIALENKYKDVVSIIIQKCINVETKEPFHFQMIETALKEIKFVVKPNKSAKQQALAAIQSLKKVINIERVQMRIHLEVQKTYAKQAKKQIKQRFKKIEQETWAGGNLDLTALIEPGEYRPLSNELNELTKGSATLDILDMSVHPDEEKLEDEK